MEGIFWSLITIAGPILLALGLAYAILRNKYQRDQPPKSVSDRASNRLYDELDREDHQRESWSIDQQENKMADGLKALFQSRAAVDLAMERLVQEYGYDRSEIFVEPVGDANTAGTEVSGGDAPDSVSAQRQDGALRGELRLIVPTTPQTHAQVLEALREVGARAIDL